MRSRTPRKMIRRWRRREERNLPRRWRRTYVRGPVAKAETAPIAAANSEMIRARDATDLWWRPGDRFQHVSALQLLHLAPHPKGAALCCDAGPHGRLISVFLDSQSKKALGHRDALCVSVEDESGDDTGDDTGGRSGGGGGRRVKRFKATLVYKACGGWLSQVANDGLLRRLKATMIDGSSVRVFLGEWGCDSYIVRGFFFPFLHDFQSKTVGRLSYQPTSLSIQSRTARQYPRGATTSCRQRCITR